MSNADQPGSVRANLLRKYEKAVHAAKKRVSDPIGALIFGSAVEQKLGRAPRDLDLITINLSGERRREVFREGEILVEHTAASADDLLWNILVERHAGDTRNVGAGVLVDWETGDDFLPKLKRIAEVNWKLGPIRTGALGYLYARLKYENFLSEIETRTETDTEREYLLCRGMVELIRDFYQLNGLYLPKWSYLLKYLAARDRVMLRYVEQVYGGGSFGDRLSGFEGAVSHAIERWGGKMKGEWSAEIGADALEVKDVSGEWKRCAAPFGPTIASSTRPFSSSISPSTLPSASPKAASPIDKGSTWWDDSNNPPFPHVDQKLRVFVNDLARRADILGVLVYGSHGLDKARSDSDVDLYVITEGRGRSIEHKWAGDVEYEIEYICFTDAYAGILSRSNTSYWRNFCESKVLFSRHPSIALMIKMAKRLMQEGLPPMTDEQIVLLRKHAYHVYDDAIELLETGHMTAFRYNAALLFVEILDDWFDLHCLLDPKRTYLLREIRVRDETLYSAAFEFLGANAEKRAAAALKTVLERVLGPYGGRIRDEWSISL